MPRFGKSIKRRKFKRVFDPEHVLERKGDGDHNDAPPPLATEKLPRALRDMMRHKKRLEDRQARRIAARKKRRQVHQQHKDKKDGPAPVDLRKVKKIRPGETYEAFCRRVNMDTTAAFENPMGLRVIKSSVVDESEDTRFVRPGDEEDGLAAPTTITIRPSLNPRKKQYLNEKKLKRRRNKVVASATPAQEGPSPRTLGDSDDDDDNDDDEGSNRGSTAASLATEALQRHLRREVKPLDFDDLQDHVAFGEVVQAPPTLAPPLSASKMARAQHRETTRHSEGTKAVHQPQDVAQHCAVVAYRNAKARRKMQRPDQPLKKGPRKHRR